MHFISEAEASQHVTRRDDLPSRVAAPSLSTTTTIHSPSARVYLSRTGLRAMTSVARPTSPSLARAPLASLFWPPRRPFKLSPHAICSRTTFRLLTLPCSSRPSTRLSRRVCSSPVRLPVLSTSFATIRRRSRLLPRPVSPPSLPLFCLCTDALSAVPPQISHIARVDCCRRACVLCGHASRI